MLTQHIHHLHGARLYLDWVRWSLQCLHVRIFPRSQPPSELESFPGWVFHFIRDQWLKQLFICCWVVVLKKIPKHAKVRFRVSKQALLKLIGKSLQRNYVVISDNPVCQYDHEVPKKPTINQLECCHICVETINFSLVQLQNILFLKSCKYLIPSSNYAIEEIQHSNMLCS